MDELSKTREVETKDPVEDLDDTAEWPADVVPAEAEAVPVKKRTRKKPQLPQWRGQTLYRCPSCHFATVRQSWFEDHVKRCRAARRGR